jgi:translocation and assembly module TamA
MQKILFLSIFTISQLFSQEYKTMEFKGEGIDFLVGTFSSSNLYKVIGKPYPPFYTPWRDDPTFESTELQQYEEAITDYFHSYGYYKAKVKASIKKGEIIVIIDKKDQIKIKEIKVHPTEKLSQYLPYKEGDGFTTEAFKASKEIIERKLLEYGHPRYSFSAKAYVDLDLYEVKIDYIADKKSIVKLGETFIEGNGDVKKEIILEALKYKDGDLYDIQKLEKSYDTIYEFGVYDYISLEPRLDYNGSKVPINIKLSMGDTKFIKNSVGYNSDTGVRGSASWIDKNFFGNLKVFDVGIKANELGYEIYNIFYDPRIILPTIGRIDFKNELTYSHTKYDSYIQKGLVNRLTFGKIFDRHKHIGKYEHFAGVLTEINDIRSRVDDANALDGSYFINSLFYRFLWDKRDSKVNARNGHYVDLYIERSDKAIGSDFDYLKAILDLRFIKSYDKFTFGIKTRIGSIDSDVPIFKRFYSGGSVTNRGYDYRDLGLKDSKGVPRGGVSLIDVLTELRYEVYNKLYLVTFYDSTMLNLEPKKFDSKFYDSYGLGIRYLTAIGPIRLDFGFPRDDSGDWRFHIGLGQTF